MASGNDPALGLTTGNLTALITYAVQTLSSLMMLSMVFTMMTIAGSSAGRIVEILNERTDIHDPEQPVMEVKNGDVRFEHVDLVYNKAAGKKVLSDINLDLKSGQTLGIIGNTGSSKSSLVQLIPRLYDVTGGRVLIGDVDVRDYDIEVLRNAVAMVLQKNQLFSGTIAENLRWGNEHATDEEIKGGCKACLRRRIHRAVPGQVRHLYRGEWVQTCPVDRSRGSA